jgi:hypothetical protein
MSISDPSPTLRLAAQGHGAKIVVLRASYFFPDRFLSEFSNELVQVKIHHVDDLIKGCQSAIQ